MCNVSADRARLQTAFCSKPVVFHEMLAGDLPFSGEREQAIVYSISMRSRSR